MQFELVGGERARQFALDEFLVGRHGVDRMFESDDGAGAFLGGRAQRQLGAARELAAGGGVARRLREAGMRADAHHGVDPMRLRDRIEHGAYHDRFASTPWRGGERHREFVAADAAAYDARRQRFASRSATATISASLPMHAELRVDVRHAVEFDHGEGRHLVAAAFGQRKVEQFEHLGVIGQTGELVLVGGAARMFFARRKLVPRAPQLPQRKSGKADQRDGDPDNERHQPVHRLQSSDRSCPR